MTDEGIPAHVAGAVREARAALKPRSLLDEVTDRDASLPGSRAAAAFERSFLAGQGHAARDPLVGPATGDAGPYGA